MPPTAGFSSGGHFEAAASLPPTVPPSPLGSMSQWPTEQVLPAQRPASQVGSRRLEPYQCC